MVPGIRVLFPLDSVSFWPSSTAIEQKQNSYMINSRFYFLLSVGAQTAAQKLYTDFRIRQGVITNQKSLLWHVASGKAREKNHVVLILHVICPGDVRYDNTKKHG